MPKYKVIVECRNEGGTDIHCWSGIEAPNGAEAEHLAVQRAARYYPEFDEFEPVRTEVQRRSEAKRMAKSYQMLYKCRLCGQVFVNYGTVSEKVAEQSTLNEVLRASGMSPMWKENDTLTMYEMHCCADGSYGVSDFIGSRKVDEDG